MAIGQCYLCGSSTKATTVVGAVINGEVRDVCIYHRNHPSEKVERTKAEDKVKEEKQKKAIAKKSVKKSIEDKLYSKIAKAFLKANPECQIKTLGCTKVAEEVHHSKGRGEHLIDTDTFIATCRNCHTWAETHPELAKTLGVSQNRLTT